MKNTGLKIETILSFIINIVLGALVFAWLDANATAAVATVAGIAVIVLGLGVSFSTMKLISKAQ